MPRPCKYCISSRNVLVIWPAAMPLGAFRIVPERMRLLELLCSALTIFAWQAGIRISDLSPVIGRANPRYLTKLKSSLTLPCPGCPYSWLFCRNDYRHNKQFFGGFQWACCVELSEHFFLCALQTSRSLPHQALLAVKMWIGNHLSV